MGTHARESGQTTASRSSAHTVGKDVRVLALGDGLGDGLREDGVEELRLAQNALGEITGQFSADDLLGVIFSKFCIGK